MFFEDYDALTSLLAEKTADRLKETGNPNLFVKEGFSNVSCSAYVNVEFYTLDEDGDMDDCIDAIKVRFSDHADRYGSDISFDIARIIEDDEMEYGLEASEAWINDYVDDAVKAVTDWSDKVEV